MKYKLIAMDFDGTLLNDNKKITPKTIEVLKKCREDENYLIVGVTARNLSSVKRDIPISLFDYLILSNGTYLFDVAKNQTICIGLLNKSDVLGISKIMINYDEQIDFVSDTTYYVYRNKRYRNLSFINNIDDISQISERISRMNIFILQQDKISYYCDYINKNYNNVNCFIMQDSFNEERWLVVNPKGVDKKITLEKLGEKLDIKLDEMIFFGDGLNDLPIIEAVGYGVAMGNALDEIKERADEVTLSNNEDGIAVSLEKKIKK